MTPTERDYNVARWFPLLDPDILVQEIAEALARERELGILIGRHEEHKEKRK